MGDTKSVECTEESDLLCLRFKEAAAPTTTATTHLMICNLHPKIFPKEALHRAFSVSVP